MKTTVAILYGLAEGPHISHRLAKMLVKNGFILTPDPAAADIIIAHSGGVYFVPKKPKAKKVLLVGATLGYSESLIRLQSRKVQLDFLYARKTKDHAFWLYKSLWNAIYLVTKLQYNWAMRTHALVTKTLLPNIDAPEVFVITYKNDPWSGTIKESEKQNFPQYKYVMTSGVHDDLWIHPENYLHYLT